MINIFVIIPLRRVNWPYYMIALKQLEATMTTLILAQRLARLLTIHALWDDIDNLCQNKKTLSDHLKPWVDEALKLAQDIDVTVKHLNQTLDSVTAATKGPTLQNLVDIAENSTAQS